MRTRALPAISISRLPEHPETDFADHAAWSAHFDRLGFTTLTSIPHPADRFAAHRFASLPEPVQIATGEAIWGTIQAHDFLRDTVVLSDEVGQFVVCVLEYAPGGGRFGTG
jgi:hypothetical protein